MDRSVINSDVGVPSETAVPSWKKELLKKRRHVNLLVDSPAEEKQETPTTGEENKSDRGRSRTRAAPARPGLVASLQAVYEPRVETSLSPTGRMPGHETASSPLYYHPAGLLHSKGGGNSGERFSASRSVSAGGSVHTRSALKNHVIASSAKPVPLNHPSSDSNMVEEKRNRNEIVVTPASKLSAKNWIASAYKENEDEELQYGPGIVNKLKSRYLSRTLREKSVSERPSLRRAASLEDWLDKETPPKQAVSGPSNDIIRSRTSAPPAVRPSSLITPPHATRNYDLKKTRSADNCGLVSRRSVSVSDLYIAPPLGGSTRGRAAHRNTPSSTATTPSPVKALVTPVKEDIVIIEKTVTKPAQPAKQPSAAAAAVATSATLKTRRILPTTTLYGVEDGELPPPDTVRQVKSIFEPDSRKTGSSRRSQSAGPSSNRIPLSVAKPVRESPATPPRVSAPHVPSPKPSPLGPKPTVLPPKPILSRPRPSKPPPPAPSPQQQVPAPVPRVSTPSQLGSEITKPAAAPSPAPAPPPTSIAPVSSAEKDLPASDSEEDEDGGETKGPKRISRSALENIRKEGTSQMFNFGEKKNTPQPQQQQIKQVGIIRPLTIDTVKTDSLEKKLERSEEIPSERLKPAPAVEPITAITDTKGGNKVPKTAKTTPKEDVLKPNKPADHSVNETTIPQKIITPTKPTTKNNEADARIQTAAETTPKILETSNQNTTKSVATPPLVNGTNSTAINKPKKRSQEQNTTTVFNFTERKQVPDHIQNDGVKRPIARYKRDDPGIVILVRPGGTTESSSDYIEDADDEVDLRRPPSPCNVHFEGWNVVINGRSSIQRQPKSKKLNISFNDDMTMLFEYPSEISLLLDDEEAPKPLVNSAAPSPTGNLASYTPSKVVVAESFELGVSRIVSSTPKATPTPVNTTPAVEEYLKPAEVDTTWSAETTADLLF